MIAREGYLIVAIAFVLAVVLVLVGFRFALVGRILIGGLALFVLGFTLYFFRDRSRE